MFRYVGPLSLIITAIKGQGTRGKDQVFVPYSLNLEPYFSGFNPEEHNSGGNAPDNICKPC